MILPKRRRSDTILGTDIFVIGPTDVPASWDSSITGGSTSYPTPYEAVKAAGGSIRVKMNNSDALFTGKWYFEVELVDRGVDFLYLYDQDGVGPAIRYYGANGQPQSGGVAYRVTDWDPWEIGDILMLAVDIDKKFVWTGKNGVWDGGADPGSGLNPTSGIPLIIDGLTFQFQLGGAGSVKLHTGDTPLNYVEPTGFHPGWYNPP